MLGGWVIVSILYFGVVVWAGMLWGTIWLLERENPYNKFVHALIYSGIRIGIDVVIGLFGFGFFFGIGFLIAYFVLAVRLLMYHYEIGFGKALAVIGMMVAVPYLAMPEIFGWVGNSWLRLGIVIYGLPTAILVAWGIGLYRGRYAKRPSNLPEARIMTRRAPQPTPAPAPAVSAPDPIPAVVRVSQPLVPLRSSAPDIEAAAAPSDGPKFLR